MKRIMMLAAVLSAAACDSKPAPSETHVRMAKACVTAGMAEAQCECAAKKVDALMAAGDISPEVVEATILQDEGKMEEADKLMLNVPYDDRYKHSTMVGDAKLECVAN